MQIINKDSVSIRKNSNGNIKFLQKNNTHNQKQLEIKERLIAVQHNRRYKHSMRQLSMYHDTEISEKQFAEGKTKDAKESLASLKEKYGL